MENIKEILLDEIDSLRKESLYGKSRAKQGEAIGLLALVYYIIDKNILNKGGE